VGKLLVRRRTRGRSTRATRAIGAAVLAVIAAGIALAYTRPAIFSNNKTVRAMFASASGLGVTGRDVRMAGAVVGSISDIKRVGDHALLTLSLDPSVGTIHTDATAELRPHLPFEGSAYVQLDPGSPTAPKLGDGVLPLSQTKVYVPIDEGLRALTPPTRAATQADTRLLTQVLSGAGVSGLQQTLKGAPQLTATLAPGAAAAEGPHGTELAGSIRGLSSTVNAFASRQRQLEPLVRQTAQTMAALSADGGVPLDQTLARFPSTLQALDSGSRALDGIVTRLDPLASQLEPGLHQLQPTLRAAEPLLLAATPVLRDAPPLLQRLRAALDAGAGATPAADALLTALRPSLTLLDSSLLPAMLAPSKKLGLPSYLSFINLFEGGGGASQPFQTPAEASLPGQMGVGHFMRFYFRFMTGVGWPLPPCTLLQKANQQLAKLAAAGGICQS
jgi:virulence factor Mce-like protein